MPPMAARCRWVYRLFAFLMFWYAVALIFTPPLMLPRCRYYYADDYYYAIDMLMPPFSAARYASLWCDVIVLIAAVSMFAAAGVTYADFSAGLHARYAIRLMPPLRCHTCWCCDILIRYMSLLRHHAAAMPVSSDAALLMSHGATPPLMLRHIAAAAIIAATHTDCYYAADAATHADYATYADADAANISWYFALLHTIFSAWCFLFRRFLFATRFRRFSFWFLRFTILITFAISITVRATMIVSSISLPLDALCYIRLRLSY